MQLAFLLLLAIGLTGYAVLLVLIAQAKLSVGSRIHGFGRLLMDTLLGMITMLFILFGLTVARQALDLAPMGLFLRWALSIGFVAIPWIAVIRWFLWRHSAGKDA